MSAYHGFDPEVAAEVGLNAAVIYQNLLFWCSKNAANGRNEHEGRFYTYNSISAFSKLFPYLTRKQIRVAISNLESKGLIGCAVLNKKKFDKTKWYCITRPDDAAVIQTLNVPERAEALPLRANAIALEGQPIPDSKPVNKPDTQKGAREENITQEVLESIWQAYPNGGKVSASLANLPFMLARPVQWLGSAQAVLRAVSGYAAECRKEDTKPKSLANFLADRALLERYASPETSGTNWRGELTLFRDYGDWRPDCPEPGKPGCKAPPELLAEFGYSERAA